MLFRSGMEGIEKKLPLLEELVINTYKANPAELVNLEKLPASLDEALKLVGESSFVNSVLPEVTVKGFLESVLENKNF